MVELANMLHPPHENSANTDAQKFLNLALITTALVSAAVIAAPLVLPAIGIGVDAEQSLLEECCNTLKENTGVAGAISTMIKSIPVVGTYLSTEGGNNILVPAVTIVGGHLAGNLMSNYEKEHGKEGNVGSAIRIGSMALGVVLSLPALLPGIAHGMLYLSKLADRIADNSQIPGSEQWQWKEWLESAARGIGNTNLCSIKGVAGAALKKATATPSVAFAPLVASSGMASLLGGHAACLFPAVISLTAPAAASKAEQILAERDQRGSSALGVS